MPTERFWNGSSWVDIVSVPSTMATTNTAQTFTAQKTFNLAPLVPDGSFTVGKISATGTRDATTYLRGDGTWATPAGGSGSGTGDMVLASAQTVTGVKTFADGTLLMNSPLATGAEPYSDANPPESLWVTEQATGVTPPTPPAGIAVVYADIAGELYTKNDAGVVRTMTSAAAGGAPAVIKTLTQQNITGTALQDITEWSALPVAPNEVVAFDAILIFTSSATASGFRFAVAAPGWTPTRFLFTFEYQTSATAWATFTQTSPTTFMATTTTAYVANSGIVCRIIGQVEAGATGGNLNFQAASETAAGIVGIRRGNTLRRL